MQRTIIDRTQFDSKRGCGTGQRSFTSMYAHVSLTVLCVGEGDGGGEVVVVSPAYLTTLYLTLGFGACCLDSL